MKHANSLDTGADHLLTEEPERRHFGWWKWLFVLVLIGLFVYRSTRPVMRLSAEPPPSFYAHNRGWDQQQIQKERLLARAYWNVAVVRIQTYYSPYRPLPAQPPPQFQISDAADTVESGVIAARNRYWYKLRDVWNERDTWVVSYGWNTGWVENALKSLPQYLPKSVTAVFRTLVDLFNDIAKRISPP